MNSEIISKTAEVASSTVGALKSSPMVLALVIFQLMTLGAILYSNIDRQHANTAQFDKITVLLDKCLAAHLDSKQ